MRIVQTRLTLDTEPREIKEITAEIQQWVDQQGIGAGLLIGVHLPHLGLAADPGKRIA